MIRIRHAVGAGQPNRPYDVHIVQMLLNRKKPMMTVAPALAEDGICGHRTIAAIREFQLRAVAAADRDGIVSPHGPTFMALADGAPHNVASGGAALDDVAYLAMTLYGEARGESHASRVAVAWVIRNRVADGRWGTTYQSVVTARGQFTCWSQAHDPGNFHAIHHPAGAAWQDCLAVAKTVVAAPASGDTVPGATHYYSPKAQAALHKLNPGLYPAVPKFTRPPAAQVPNPPGVPATSFRFYKNVS